MGATRKSRHASDTSLVVDGLEVKLRRGGVRRVNLRLRPDGSIYLSAPAHVCTLALQEFVRARRSWIDERQRQLAKRQRQARSAWQEGSHLKVLDRTLTLHLISSPREAPSARMEGTSLMVSTACADPSAEELRLACTPLLTTILRAELPPLFEDFEQRMGVQHGITRLRWMTSRWGSCNVRTASICINLELALRPRICLESVVAHELCHLMEPSHNAHFYALMGHYYPHWREAKALLRDNPPSR